MSRRAVQPFKTVEQIVEALERSIAAGQLVRTAARLRTWSSIYYDAATAATVEQAIERVLANAPEAVVSTPPAAPVPSPALIPFPAVAARPVDAIVDLQYDDVGRIARDALQRHEAKRRVAATLATEVSPIEVLTLEEFDAQPAAEWIVPDWVLEASLGLLIGHPDSAKTFTALDLGLSYAAEFPTWLGQPLRKHGSVVYVVGEGRLRMKHRIRAWRQHHQVWGELPFRIVPAPVNLLDAQMLDTFLAAIAEHEPGLVFIDTLNRCLPGSDESNKDFGFAVAAAGRVQAETGAAVQILHHPTKTGESARGGGALFGAADAELWLMKTGRGRFTLDAKEGRSDAPVSLVLREVTLEGVLEGGSPVTSAVIELADVTRSGGDVSASGSVYERVVSYLRTVEDATVQQIAEKTGVKPNSVVQALRRRDKPGDTRSSDTA